ncbi:HU family DNA-binding protein [Kitasatospora sp. NPDC098663]|uniref:HU family DNA-binding protein n=1 Tax=Kitasatospora sp. NPDC098663 TaxID=3364096 RepID=UPI0037F1BE2B
MNKSQLIDAIAETAEIERDTAAAALAALTDSITRALKTGDDVELGGFGTFRVRERRPVDTTNPATGKAITISGVKFAQFATGKRLKDALN